ncbi:MAG: G5 domain-containing protein [Chloroflexi bacterium]|nr:G5 domain-containing protein [Chloroflexota bacterium]
MIAGEHHDGRRGARAKRRGRGLLLLIIFSTCCTLVFTLFLFARAIPRWNSETGGSLVSIEHDGARQTISTRLETVGELLSQLGLEAPENGALSHSAEDLLVDGMLIRILPPRAVTLVINGDERQLQTPLENPWDILFSLGVTVGATDRIWVNGALANLDALPDWTVPARHIRIRRAAGLTIIDDGVESSILAKAESVGDALFQAGIRLNIADQVTPELETAPTDQMTIHIKRALPIKLLVDGVKIDARTNAALVGDALAELNAPLFGLDYALPPADSVISENMTIEILRVTEDILTVSEAIDFAVSTRLDDALDLDDVAVVQEGRQGRQETRYRVRYENGVEISREQLESVVVAAPVDKIVAYGSRIAQQVVDTPAGPRHYWRRLCVYATSYKPESNSGNTRTSTGATLAKGIVAAKPHIIPYYTQVYVPDYGIGVVRDTGAGPRSTPYWIDLGYSDHDWITWGSYTWVYLLGSPPADINYDLPPWAPVRNRPQGCAG